MPRTLVAIPALNEAATIGAVISDVRAAVPGAHVVVIDDGSVDATGEVAQRAGAQVIRLPFNVGVGGAMRTAFLYAQRHDFDVVVQVDADGQHIAEHIPGLVATLDRASVVVGSRFAGGYEVRGPRELAMRTLARSLSRACRTTLTDTTSGFRSADRRAIALFAQHYPAEYLGDTVESLVLAARAGLVVTEVPVRMLPRQGGQPSQGPVRSVLYLGRALLALYVALSRRPIPVTDVVAASPIRPGVPTRRSASAAEAPASAPVP
ncbi:MAG: glycosyltransferase family 2 protein [Candidatus Nanopelagicales bacterium]|jgi:glycosyltransferase involved in cell wall biosynthesis|nr:glycosyltransferase family 2 protein [Candidatus Nanopelagicales bacterium]